MKLGIGLIGHPKVQKKAPKLSGRGNVQAFIALWKEFATTPEFNIFTIDVVTSWTLDTAVIEPTAIAEGKLGTRKPAAKSAKLAAMPAAKPATTRLVGQSKRQFLSSTIDFWTSNIIYII